MEHLKDWGACKLWTPKGLCIIAKASLSSTQFVQWKLSFSEETKAKLNDIGPFDRNIARVQVTYEVLTGKGKMGQSKKASYPPICHLSSGLQSSFTYMGEDFKVYVTYM